MKSDSDLHGEIQLEIARQLGAHADAVDPQVSQGMVTLTGTLQSDLERWTLRDAVVGLPGVRGCMDEILIAPVPSMRAPDPDIARPWFPAR